MSHETEQKHPETSKCQELKRKAERNKTWVYLAEMFAVFYWSIEIIERGISRP